MIWIIAIILVAIFFQLWRSNKLKEHRIITEKNNKEEEKKNEEEKIYLENKFPHLYYEMGIREKLRDYYLDIVDSRNNPEAYSEEYHPNLLTWHSFKRRISKDFENSSNKNKIEDKLLEYVKYSKEFTEFLIKKRDTTMEERKFILFLVWERIFENITEERDILDSMDIDTIKWWHEEYEDFFPKK